MIRLISRRTNLAGILAAVLLALLYTPDGEHALPAWDREPHELLLILWGIVGAAVLVIAGKLIAELFEEEDID